MSELNRGTDVLAEMLMEEVGLPGELFLDSYVHPRTSVDVASKVREIVARAVMQERGRCISVATSMNAPAVAGALRRGG